MQTIALVAAKDAEGSIGDTVRALGALPEVDEVWVVDDGSSDGTERRAREAGARVVVLARNLGKGGALAAGVAATPHAQRYLLADADLGTTAGGLRSLFDAGNAELVIGVLPAAGKRAGFGSVKRFAGAGIRRATGLRLVAPLSGQRLVDAAVLRASPLAARFGVEVGMTIDAARQGARVTEVPVNVDHHHTGRSVAGFVHRARQGRDIARALMPRLSSVPQRVVVIAATAVAVFLLLSAVSAVRAAPEGDALPRADHVVLFAFDQLSLDDLGRPDLPALRAVAHDGAVGALSVRTTDRRSLDRRTGPERPSVIDAFASIGASGRVRVSPQLAQHPADGVEAAMRDARALARRDKASALPGALGDALHRAGRRTALVAGAQGVNGEARSAFPAAAALADRRGRIDLVDTSDALLEPEATPSELRASVPAFVAATVTALRSAAVVLVDAGETARAVETGSGRAGALRRTDEILGGVRATLPPRTTLIVFAPTPPGAKWQLTPIVVVSGGDRGGVVASPATHRAAMAVLTDIAPTVLHTLGAATPPSMTGSTLRRASGAFDGADYARLSRDGAARSRFFLGAAVGYTVFAIALYLLVIAAVLMGRITALRRELRFVTVAAAAFPLALLITGAIQHWGGFGGESPALLVGVCVGLAALTTGWRGLAPLYGFATAAVALTALDVAATGPIHTASLLGYTLQTTGRFYGLPNASFSVFASSLILVAVAVAGGLRPPSLERGVAGVAVLAVGVGFVASPWLGNDVGGTLALVPVSAAMAWTLLGGRFTRRVAALGLVTVGLGLAALLGVEALSGSQTHLARAASGGITTTLAHRADVNLGLLVDQWWGFLVFGLAGLGLVLVARGEGESFLPFGSPLRSGFAAVLVLSLLAFLANDSGPVVSVLCLVVAAPVLALRTIDAAQACRPPSTIS